MAFDDTLPSKQEVFDVWKSRLSDLGFHIDWGEPSCWACGFHYGTKYDIKRSNASISDILACWGRIPLQRCHIVPRSLGGSDLAENLFLMCRECHDTAPNTDLPEIFFSWARKQSWHARENAKIRSAFEAFDLDIDADEGLAAVLVSADFREWVSSRFGLHRPQSNYAPISSRLTPATMVGLAVEYRRRRSEMG